MLYTTIGIIVCLTPFILICLYKNKAKGFLTIFTTLSVVHVLTALATQSFGIFSYSVVLCVHVVVALYSIYVFIFSSKHTKNVEGSRGIHEDNRFIVVPKMLKQWFVLAIIALGLFLLYFTRFDYTGPVDTAVGLKQVSHSSYTYPQYSDEWIGSGLVSYSIREKALPLVNPLNPEEPFMNFLVAAHSLFAEVILVFNLNPLTQYVYLAILNGVLLAIGVYLILRLLLVRSSFASISALSVLLLTNSGNLPSTWYILPYIASLTFFLFGIASFLIKSRFAYLTSISISLVIYPPIIIFAAPFLLAASYTSYRKKLSLDKVKTVALQIGLIFLVVSGLLVLILSQSFSLLEIYDRTLSFLFRQGLDTGKVLYHFWNVIPVFLIPCICVGLFDVYRPVKINETQNVSKTQNDQISSNQNNRTILITTIIGVVLWIMYGFTNTIFLIEPSRVVVITSMLLIIIAGIGMERMYTELDSYFDLNSELFLKQLAKICFVVFFLFWIISSPKLGLWHKLSMIVASDYGAYSLLPAPPLSRYLTREDLALFSEYTDKRFISSPWKGLVLGIATENTPLDSKSSTLSNQTLRYKDFMKGDCIYKTIVARRYRVNLVYSTPFSCPKYFFEKGKSSEGFVLYEFREIE